MKEIRKPDETLASLLPPVRPQPGCTYIPTRFALPFTHRGKRYVFNNLTKQCIEGTLPASARAGEGWDDLIAAQFLVPEDRDECAYYSQISAMMRAFRRKKGERGYTILPTLGCNARCVYCYEEGMKPVTMTPETAEQTVRYIRETHAGGTVRLSWFGGEPLLCPEIIDRICAGLRDAGLEWRSAMVTNGSLVTPEIIRRMTEDWRLRRIQVSMDGAEPDYIARKRYRACDGAYRRVIGAIGALSEAGVSVTVRCNVDAENWERIPRFMADLKDGVACRGKVAVYFSPLNAVRMGAEDVAMWEKIRDGRHLITEAGFRAEPFRGLGLGFRVSHCMADAGSVVIGPDGSLYPCEHCPPESRFGDVFRGVTDEAARQAFCRTDRTRAKCADCPFLPDCTSFAACPVEDTHCREVRMLMVTDALRRLADKTESGDPDGEDPIC